VLRDLAPTQPFSASDLLDPNLLVGFELSDDAGVYRLNSEMALVQTVDVFTPIVDDAFCYGQIAAANALSDVYAMGGRPLTVLNIAGFPRQKLPFEVLGDILRGALSKTREAGATVVGGHTVETSEPLFGLSVTGLVHPDRIATNAGARLGDVLLLTKSLGTGLISTAIKRESCPPDSASAAIASMTALNRGAAEAMMQIGIGAAASIGGCTDISGFGLAGHALEMARASRVRLQIETARLPLLPHVEALARDDRFVPGGTARNAESGATEVHLRPGLSAWWRHLLFDPQTSGGLLIAVRAEDAEELERELKAHGAGATTIGRVVAGESGIEVI
jgi:selenide,water dikinase